MSDTLPNLRHMRVLLETVRCGSVSRAAERCLLSQPAATQALNRLEADLGADLLVRQARQSATTDCGALFVRRVEAALDLLREGARAAHRLAREGARGRPDFDKMVTAAHLRTLIAVSNRGSFTLAATDLGLAQPTVHRAARALEDIAGVPFFRVTATGVELTVAAQAFALNAKLALAEIRQGVEEIGRELGDDRGTFRLGSLPLARTFIVPRATHAMIAETQGVQVQIVDGRYPELLRSLREGDLDCLIGALRDPLPAEDVQQEPLFLDELVIVAHPDHPLARCASASVEDTLAYPWVAPPKTTPAGTYLFETLRIHERPRTPVRVVSSSLVMLRGILAQGPYVSIISRHQITTEIADGHMRCLPIRLKGNRRPIGLTYRRNWRPTSTQRRFLDHLRGFAGQVGVPGS